MTATHPKIDPRERDRLAEELAAQFRAAANSIGHTDEDCWARVAAYAMERGAIPRPAADAIDEIARETRNIVLYPAVDACNWTQRGDREPWRLAVIHVAQAVANGRLPHWKAPPTFPDPDIGCHPRVLKRSDLRAWAEGPDWREHPNYDESWWDRLVQTVRSLAIPRAATLRPWKDMTPRDKARWHAALEYTVNEALAVDRSQHPGEEVWYILGKTDGALILQSENGTSGDLGRVALRRLAGD